MTEQIPNIDPLAVEAEKSLLGAMMFSATAVADEAAANGGAQG